MLGLYIDTTFMFIQDGYKPLAESFENFFQALSMFIEKTKYKPNNHILFKKI